MEENPHYFQGQDTRSVDWAWKSVQGALAGPFKKILEFF